MPTKGERLPQLNNSNTNRTTNPQLRRNSQSNRNSLTASRDSLNHRSTESAIDFGQRSKGRIGHRRIDVNRRPLGSKYPTTNNNSITRDYCFPRSMEGNAAERNWDSEGGRPKSPQRQPAPRPAKKSGFRRLLQRPSFEGLMPFQRPPRDGSYEKSLPVTKARSSRVREGFKIFRDPDDNNEGGEKTRDNGKTSKNATTKSKSKTSKLQDSATPSKTSLGAMHQPSNAKTGVRNNVPTANGRKEPQNHQTPPLPARLQRSRRSQDRSHSYSEIDNSTTSSSDAPPVPLPLSRSGTSIDRGPNSDGVTSTESSLWESIARANSRNANDILPGDPEESPSLPHSPPSPLLNGSHHFASARDGLTINQSSRPGSTLIDLSPRDTISTSTPRHSLNDLNTDSSPRDPYSTLAGSPRRNSSPVPPPRTSASLGARESLLNHTSPGESQRQPNSVFRQHLRQTPPEPQDSLPRQRQRANSEQPRISSPRFRNLLSRRGSSSSNSSRENSQNNDDTTGGGGERRRSRSSFWRNLLFSRLGSAERRSRSRSESAASSRSNSSQEGQNPTPPPSTSTTSGRESNPFDADFPGFPFRRRPMSRGDRGSGFNRNDSGSGDPAGPGIIRLTLGPSGADIGRLLSAAGRNADGSPSSGSGATGSGTNNEDDFGMSIALIGSPMMSPPVDLTTIPPRLLLSFLLQGRRELGNEFVELVLENLLLSILARHMMEVGGQVGGTGAHPPATQEMIDKLEGLVVEQQHVDDDLNCAICHVEYELSEKLSKLPCTHFFHPTCITIWLKKSATCPVCRFKLTRPSENPAETADVPSL